MNGDTARNDREVEIRAAQSVSNTGSLRQSYSTKSRKLHHLRLHKIEEFSLAFACAPTDAH